MLYQQMTARYAYNLNYVMRIGHELGPTLANASQPILLP